MKRTTKKLVEVREFILELVVLLVSVALAVGLLWLIFWMFESSLHIP